MYLKQKLQHLSAVVKGYVHEPVRSLRGQFRQPALLQGARFAREWPTNGEVAKTGRSVADAKAAALETAASPNRLQEYFNAHHEGPGIYKWLHYFEVYDRHLAKFVGKEVNIVEIGVFGGGSLAMWRAYFGPGARITGVDVNPECMKYENEYTKILIGDQEDRSFWKKLRAEVPPTDILIDDGGHTPGQQVVTLEEGLPHLRPGGVFLCEDILGLGNYFTWYLGGLNDALHAYERQIHPLRKEDVMAHTTSFQSCIHSIHQYPYVVVIEKREKPLPSLEAIHHGAEWPS